MIRWVLCLVALGSFTGDPAGARRRSDPDFWATALLERRAPGTLPRVRFEWIQRRQTAEYLLIGSWTAAGSWTVQRADYRVTRTTATSWAAERVTFEVSLPPGDHSWRLAPVRSAGGSADLAAASQVGFELP